MEQQSEVPTTTSALTAPTRNFPSAAGPVSSSVTISLSRDRSMDVTLESPKHTGESSAKIQKAMSLDSAETDESKKQNSSFTRSSFKRRSIRRRSSKRLERPEVTYGNNTAEYEAIQDRVLEERAVVNAIEALQERWRMLMYMYDDCVELNEGRKDRRQKKLCVKRQFELIVIITLFLLMCLPTAIVMIFMCRLR